MARVDILSAFLPNHTIAAPPQELQSNQLIKYASALNPKETLQVLSLLDQMDIDVNLEVARVKDSIREAHELVKAYKEERQARVHALMEKQRQELQETKEADRKSVV